MVAIFMSFRPRVHLLPLCLLALIFPCASRAQAPAALTVGEIVRRAVVRDDALRAARLGMKCDQTIKIERLDPDGKVTSVHIERSVHFQTKGITFNTDVAADEKSGAAVAKRQTDHVETVMNLGKLAGRFEMALAEDALVKGRNCYVVRYWPKSGQTSETREEKVVNNLKGRFWIAKDDFSIVQSLGVLSSPVTVALIASVNRLDFNYESQTLPNGDIAPLEASVNIAVKAPFYDFREKKTTTHQNWR